MTENIETCKVIITAEFNENGDSTPEYQEYSQRSNANGEAHGGIVTERYMIEKNLGDGATPSVVVVIEYPSKEKAIDAFTNSEYKSIIPLRKVAFKEVNILISKD